MTNAELFLKAMIVGGGFAIGVAIFIWILLLFAVIIGCSESDNR